LAYPRAWQPLGPATPSAAVASPLAAGWAVEAGDDAPLPAYPGQVVAGPDDVLLLVGCGTRTPITAAACGRLARERAANDGESGCSRAGRRRALEVPKSSPRAAAPPRGKLVVLREGCGSGRRARTTDPLDREARAAGGLLVCWLAWSCRRLLAALAGDAARWRPHAQSCVQVDQARRRCSSAARAPRLRPPPGRGNRGPGARVLLASADAGFGFDAWLPRRCRALRRPRRKPSATAADPPRRHPRRLPAPRW